MRCGHVAMLLIFKFVSRGLVMKTASKANSPPPASLVICAASVILRSPASTGGFTELLPCGAADSATYRGMVKAGRVGQGFGGADDNDVMMMMMMMMMMMTMMMMMRRRRRRSSQSINQITSPSVSQSIHRSVIGSSSTPINHPAHPSSTTPQGIIYGIYVPPHPHHRYRPSPPKQLLSLEPSMSTHELHY